VEIREIRGEVFFTEVRMRKLFLLVLLLVCAVPLFSVDYLIVLAKASYVEEIQPFVQFKQAQGRSVRVEVLEGYSYFEGSDLTTSVGNITVDGETFTNVAKGNQNYVVLKHYIKKWWTEAGQPGTFYVLLVGSASQLSPYFNGYRSDLLYDVTWRIWRDHEYWNLDADADLEAMVGRWPVYTEQDVTTIGEKTIRYANCYGDWTQDIRVFGTFEEDAVPLAEHLRTNTPYTVSEMYGSSDAHDLVTQQYFVEGHSLYLYRGHGGPYVWQGGDYATKDYYENGLLYPNFNKHSVMLSISCDTGFIYDITQHPFAGSPNVWGMVNGNYRNIGEQYLLQPNGGVSFFGASVYMSSGTDQELAVKLVQDIADNNVRDMGILTLNSKTITPSYNLLGDPDLDIIFRTEPVLPLLVDLQPVSTQLTASDLAVTVKNNGTQAAVGTLDVEVLKKVSGTGTQTLLDTNFESANPFTFGGTSSTWQYGTPTYKVTAAYSGTKVIATSLTGKYNRSEDSYAQIAVNLGSSTTPATLSFWHAYDFDGGYASDLGKDIGIIEISANGTSWQVLTPAGGYPDTVVSNPIYPSGTPCYAGRNLTWHAVTAAITGYTGTVYLRFRVITDATWTYAGWYIDDVKITRSGTETWQSYYQNSGSCTVAGQAQTTVHFSNSFPAGDYRITVATTCSADTEPSNNTLTSETTLGSPTNTPPVASFTNTVSGLAVTFTDSSTDSDGTIVSRSWNFGDSSTSTTQNPLHTYAAAGTYTVTLTATDNGGATNTYSANVTVTASAPTTYTNSTVYNIPDYNTTGIFSPITVTRTGDSGSVIVTVDITHTYSGDLSLYLIAPDGSSYTLRERSGGSTDNIKESYTVNATGKVSNGEWKLNVKDLARITSGKLNSWSIKFSN